MYLGFQRRLQKLSLQELIAREEGMMRRENSEPNEIKGKSQKCRRRLQQEASWSERQGLCC